MGLGHSLRVVKDNLRDGKGNEDDPETDLRRRVGAQVKDLAERRQERHNGVDGRLLIVVEARKLGAKDVQDDNTDGKGRDDAERQNIIEDLHLLYRCRLKKISCLQTMAHEVVGAQPSRHWTADSTTFL